MFFALAPPSLALLALSLLGLAKPVALAELGQGTTPNAVNKVSKVPPPLRVVTMSLLV